MTEKKQKIADPDQQKDTSARASGEEDLGYIELADDVIAIVASLAAMDVPGVVDMSTGFREGISNFLGKKSLAKGVRVKITGHSCRIAVYVTVEYGCNIPEVAMKLQKKIKSAVDEMTEYTAELYLREQGPEGRHLLPPETDPLRRAGKYRHRYDHGQGV